MDYLQGFRMDVMTEIGHLLSRMDRWELSQAGFQGSSYQGVVIRVVDIPVVDLMMEITISSWLSYGVYDFVIFFILFFSSLVYNLHDLSGYLWCNI